LPKEREYTKLFTRPKKESTLIPKYMKTILDSFKNNIIPNEPLVSCYIQRMLTELLLISSDASNENLTGVNPVMKVMAFIWITIKTN